MTVRFYGYFKLLSEFAHVVITQPPKIDYCLTFSANGGSQLLGCCRGFVRGFVRSSCCGRGFGRGYFCSSHDNSCGQRRTALQLLYQSTPIFQVTIFLGHTYLGDPPLTQPLPVFDAIMFSSEHIGDHFFKFWATPLTPSSVII